MKTDLFQSCGHCWVFQIGWHIECSTFTASSYRIWNSSTGIPSPPLALFVVVLSKAHLTSHSRMSGSRSMITPSSLSGSWRSFLWENKCGFICLGIVNLVKICCECFYFLLILSLQEMVIIFFCLSHVVLCPENLALSPVRIFFLYHLEDACTAVYLANIWTTCGSIKPLVRSLLLGRKATTKLDSILKITYITLLKKFCIVKSMIFLVVLFGCENCSIKKTEHQSTDAFKWCWRRLLRETWTARRSNQSILKEINPEYSLEGLLLMLKLQYFGHWMWRAWCWEELKARGEGCSRGWDSWMVSLTQWTWIWANSRRWWRIDETGILQSTGSIRDMV